MVMKIEKWKNYPLVDNTGFKIDRKLKADKKTVKKRYKMGKQIIKTFETDIKTERTDKKRYRNRRENDQSRHENSQDGHPYRQNRRKLDNICRVQRILEH
jgi:hypothetical protein